MKIGIGMKCPKGHFRVQTMIGEPKCPKCGGELVRDDAAANTAMNRSCRHCGTTIAFNVYDDGKCPKCRKPWE